MAIERSIGEVATFTVDGILYEYGMIKHPSYEHYPAYRAELHANGELVEQYEYTWTDIKEEKFVDPIDYAKRSIEVFNAYLEEKHSNDDRGYNEIVNDYFLLETMFNGSLIIHTTG